MSGVVIRRASPGDAAALVELGLGVAAEPEGWLLTDGGWRSAADERRHLKSLRGSGDAAVFVAEDAAGRLVGRLSVARDTHPAGVHVADLGILVAADCRRQGIGRDLLAAAVAWARGEGVLKLELHVFPHNAAAIALYERHGFVREGLRRGRYLREGVPVDVVLMALAVS